MSRPNFYRFRVKLVREKMGEPFGTALSGPGEAYRVADSLLREEAQEVFLAFYLDSRNRVRGFREVTRGILDASLIHPREVFQGALLANAAAVIIAHNHPSGDPSPSSEDRAVTRQLAKAGRALGIPVLDSLVVGRGRYISLANELCDR